MRVREERERLGLSQTDLGVAGGVGRQSQFNYESGKRAPDAEYLAAVAQLGVDVRYVITGLRDYEPPAALTADEQVLLAHYRAASPPVRSAALGALLGAQARHSGATMTFHAKVGGIVQGDVTTFNTGKGPRPTKPRPKP